MLSAASACIRMESLQPEQMVFKAKVLTKLGKKISDQDLYLVYQTPPAGITQRVPVTCPTRNAESLKLPRGRADFPDCYVAHGKPFPMHSCAKGPTSACCITYHE